MKTKYTRFPWPAGAWITCLALLLALCACRSKTPPVAAVLPAPSAKPAAAVEAPQPEEEPAAKEEPAEPAEPEAPAETPKEEQAEEPAAEGQVALVDDTATQLLRERLSPPKQPTVSPPAGSREPSGREVGAVELLSLSLFKLPGADVSKEPGLLPSERLRTPFTHPALDVPPLAFAPDPVRPDVPKLPVGPRAFVASPDARRTPHIERFPRDAEPPVLPADDPSASASRGVITTALALPAPVPAPPQLLSIPDPFEHARAVELREPPPDADPPVASHVRPTRPVLTPPPAPPAPKP